MTVLALGIVGRIRDRGTRVAEIGERHADGGDSGRIGGREFRGIECGEVREQCLVLLAQLRVPGIELPALVLVDVARIDVGDGVAGVEKLEKKRFGRRERAGLRRESRAADEEPARRRALMVPA